MNTKYLMKSTSGIRGIVGPGLTAPMVTEYGAAFGTILKRKKVSGPLVIGRDSRPSGEMFSHAFSAGAQSVGVNIVDVGIVPTPTVEMAVIGLNACAGVCVTASHNPSPWNALKFFDVNGEFINARAFKALEECFLRKSFKFQRHDRLGSLTIDTSWVEKHIKATLKLKGIAAQSIRRKKLTVVVDAVNGAGSGALPDFLERLGVSVIRINCIPDGLFPHTPEPTPDNLVQLSKAVRKHKAQLGLACDPDADRLAVVDETGAPIGEELTLALAVKRVLQVVKSPVVVNLSTSRATTDVAEKSGARFYLSKVGEANVVAEMKKRGATIGGEGNGGVIYGALHYGRDSLVAAGLVLSELAKSDLRMSELAGTVPKYYTIKGKAQLPKGFERRLEEFVKSLKKRMPDLRTDTRDGVRFDFTEGWLQIRKSNTEPIYRMIVETYNEKLTAEYYRLCRGHFK
jgi:phosphomannomutase